MEKEYAIGIDLGGTSVKYALIDNEGVFYFQGKLPSKADVSAEAVIGQLVTAINEVKAFAQEQGYKINGIGIGTPGIVDSTNRIVLGGAENINGWEKFARRLADNKYRVYITGSNAKMLGSDVATTLGGRYITKHIMPYSFPEFLQANEVSYDSNTLATTFGRAEVQRHFTNYFRFGGFPEGARLASKREYINSVSTFIWARTKSSREIFW